MKAVLRFDSKNTIEDVRKKCHEWINTAELQRLLELFGYAADRNAPFSSQLAELSLFSDKWDFRGGLKTAGSAVDGEKARWMTDGRGLTPEQRDCAIEAANALGMMDLAQPELAKYDAVCILGGARYSPLYRARYAAMLLDEGKVTSKKVVGLTAFRDVLESERIATDSYAPGAKNEHDLMVRAINDAFHVTLGKMDGCDNQNHNLSWEIDGTPDKKILLYVAPSSEPFMRRANTSDTIRFWLERDEGTKVGEILQVTSQIYVPYQQIEAIRTLGLPRNIGVETVGYPIGWNSGLQGMQKPENYLQEIRSTILAMERMLKVYEK